MITTKRIYDDYREDDGYRILVDRLWPRGVSKEKAHLDMWMKEIAPSADLRKWFDHDPKKWEEFKKRYEVELTDSKEYMAQLRQLQSHHKKITLLYGARDTQHNEAVVLAELLTK